MSQIANLMKQLNIPDEKLKALATALNENPMSALALVQELNIPPETLQQLMGIVMTNPASVVEFAKSLGVSDETVKEVQERLNNLPK